MKQILIVEDDELLNKMLVYNLQSESYGIVSVETVKEAMEVLKSQQFDLVLLDINLPDGNGCVYVHDVNLTQLSLEEQISFRRWHIGVIFQKYNLIPAMNVFENIVLPAKLLEKKVDEKEVFRLAKMLGIEDKLFQVPDELSGGQQQRAAIARAVYTHPTILLGDELTGNLDSGTSISVMRLLKEICRQYKQTLLIVTHDENVAAMADRIICMKDGKVVKDENI